MHILSSEKQDGIFTLLPTWLVLTIVIFCVDMVINYTNDSMIYNINSKIMCFISVVVKKLLNDDVTIFGYDFMECCT